MGWTVWGSNFGRCKRFCFSPKHPDRFWGPPATQSMGATIISLTTHLHPVPRLRISGVNPLLPLYAFLVWAGKNVPLCIWYTGWIRKKSQYLREWQHRPLKEEVHLNICLILNGYRDRVVWVCRPNFFRGLSIKSKVFERLVDTRDELLARILGAAASIEKCEDQLRRTTRDLHTGVDKPIEEFWNIYREL